jgi:hypothetical protein
MRKARPVREQLTERDRLEIGVDAPEVVGEDLADRRSPGQLALVDQRADQGRSHGLGAGAQVDRVGDPDRLGRPDLADADGPDGREPIPGEDRADQARQVVLVADGGEHLAESLVRLDRCGIVPGFLLRATLALAPRLLSRG